MTSRISIRYVHRWVFVAAFIVYFATGLWLSLGHEYLLGDALSRVAAARSVIFSRDPHVAAIGFVFTPLNALAELPAVALSGWFPAITRWGIAASLVSALAMAGAVSHLYGACIDRHISRRYALLLTALFALNPMIVFYGANGMSEALFLCCICWAVRRLIRWLYTDDSHDLLATGCALAFAYLVRYDAIVAAAAGSVLVGLTSFLRARRAGRSGRAAAFMDVTIVAGIPGLAFLGWAATSWLITGQAFQQFSSTYGNSAVLAQTGAQAAGLSAGLRFAIVEMLVLGPITLVLAPIAATLARRRRDGAVLVVAGMLGAVLAFQTASYIAGATFGFLRFYIAVIALQMFLVIVLESQHDLPPSKRPGRYMHVPPGEAPLGTVARSCVALSLAVSAAVTAGAMTVPSIAPQENAVVVLLPRPFGHDIAVDADRQHTIASFSTERAIAAYIDAMDLPAGSVLTDSLYGFAVTAASERPDVFIIPSDQDFVTILNHPAQSGVRYILTVPNKDRGISDAINRRYPTMYDNGAEIATLDIEVPNDGANQPPWRIYRVLMDR